MENAANWRTESRTVYSSDFKLRMVEPRPQRPTALQRGQRAFTEYVRHNRPPYPVIRVKQPALA